MPKFALFFAFLVLAARSVLAFGPAGHALVGAIADARLAGTPTGVRVSELLDGMSLERAAVLPDQIKGWDKNGADSPGGLSLPDYPRIEAELRAFWKANPPAQVPRSKDDSEETPSHHWFHYTDIPLLGHTQYNQGKHGRSRWDIVHLIPLCLDVLSGRIPADNPRAITPTIAVILLAHALGDIHQPLHVGAEFFDANGQPVDPDAPGVQDVLEDQGGNTLFLILQTPLDPAKPHRRLSLHGFWDNDVVKLAIAKIAADIKKEHPDHAPEFRSGEITAPLLARGPADGETPGGAEEWANEGLPLAREAHARLEYSNIQPREDRGVVVASGFVREKPTPDGRGYAEWARDVITLQLAKAGWRLADLLEKSLPGTR